MDSILETVKHTIGGLEGVNEFDVDLIMFINSTLSTLHQIGGASAEGLFIEDDGATWQDLVPDDNILLGFVKTYVQQKTKLRFDPPSSSALLEALKQSIAELEWRIEVYTSSKTKEVNA